MNRKHVFTAIWMSLIIFSSCIKPEAPHEDDFAKIGLIKTAVFNDENGNNQAEAGETVTYHFQIKNLGTRKLSGILLQDTRIGLENQVFDTTVLEPAQETGLDITYTLTFDDISDGSITNQATVTAVDSTGQQISDLSDDNDYEENDPTELTLDLSTEGPYSGGIFVCNQGNFGQGNASLTVINSDNTVIQNAYELVNGEGLGDTVQSVYFYGTYAYFVVNNSHKVVVANRYTLDKIAEISGENINNPRYFTAVGNTGYISNWGDALNPDDDFIAVVDLLTNTVTGTIPVGEGPEEMLIHNDKIYVNLQGGWGYGHEVAVIDTADNTLTSVLELGAKVPNSILEDENGDIWVLCGGKPDWTGEETQARLLRITDDQTVYSYDFDAGLHPDFLSYDSGKLYFYMNGKIYASVAGDSASNYIEVSGMDGNYYFMTTHNGKLYALDAGDYVSEGTLKIYDLTTNGLLETYTTGLIPGYVGFNE